MRIFVAFVITTAASYWTWRLFLAPPAGSGVRASAAA